MPELPPFVNFLKLLKNDFFRVINRTVCLANMTDLVSFGEFEELPELPEDIWWEILMLYLSPVWLVVSKFTLKICQKIIRETKESPLEAVNRGNLLMLPYCPCYIEIRDVSVLDMVLEDYYYKEILVRYSYLFSLRDMFKHAMGIDYRWKELYAIIISLRDVDMPEDVLLYREISHFNRDILSFIERDVLESKNIKAVRFLKSNHSFPKMSCLTKALSAGWYDGVKEFYGPEVDFEFAGCKNLKIEKPLHDIAKDIFCGSCQQNVSVHFKDFNIVSKSCTRCDRHFRCHPDSKSICYKCSLCVMCGTMRESHSTFCNDHIKLQCVGCHREYTRPLSYRGYQFKCLLCDL